MKTRKPIYAKGTNVPVAQSKGDVQAIVGKYGGILFNIREIPGRVEIMFRSNSVPPRNLRIMVLLPVEADAEQKRCEIWRSLYISIKAKFVAVAAGIELFDQAFMAWIVGADNKTLFEKAEQLHLLPPAAE